MSPARFAGVLIAAVLLTVLACGGADPDPTITKKPEVTPPFTPRVSPVAPPGQDVFYNGNGGWVYQAKPITCLPMTINGVERCVPVGGVQHFCCPGQTRTWIELEVGESFVGWSGWDTWMGPMKSTYGASSPNTKKRLLT